MKRASRVALFVAFGLILGLGLGASLLVYRAADRVADSNRQLVEEAIADLSAIARLKADIAEHERLAYELYAVIDAEAFAPLLLDQRKVVAAQLDELERLGMDPDRIGRVASLWSAITGQVDALIDNIGAAATSWDAARDQLAAASERRRMLNPMLDQFSRRLQRQAEVAERQTQHDLEFMSRLVLVYTIAIGLIAVATAWLLRRLIRSNDESRALAQFPARNPMPVLKLDGEARVRFANRAAERYAAAHLGDGAGAAGLVTAELAARLRSRATGPESGRAEERLGERLVEYNWHWLADRRAYHVYLRDITEERAARDRLRRMAYEDDLTDLANRRAMVEHLERLLAAGPGTCLVLVGVERFHMLAPSVGVSGADEVLEQLAQGVRAAAQSQLGPDVKVARMEAAVFAVAWRTRSPRSVLSLDLDRLAQALPGVVRTARVSFHAAWNMGVCRARDGAGVESLISDAGAALVAVERRSGVRCLVHDETIREREQQALHIEEKLHEAIDSGERGLAVYLQPQVALEDGRVLGAEALLRWSDPELGNVSPGVFIPLAEQSGLITRLGRWVTETCMDILADWRSDSRMEPLSIAVNVAPDELHDEGYADRIVEWLRQRGVPPERFEVEITERVLADSAAMNRAGSLDQLSRAGVPIAIDDFGTGYSSLAYLAQMPIRRIKIDKQFVDRLPPGEERVLAPIIINLAGELGMECLAEGVETAAQAEYLLAAGCPLAQGYLYAPALEREAFERYARKRE